MTLLQTPHVCPAAWTGAQMMQNRTWVTDLTTAQIEQVQRAVAPLAGSGRDLDSITDDESALSCWQPLVEQLRQQLEGGCGFALLRHLPVQDLDVETARWLLWVIGRSLGTPEPQDGAGNLLHDVRDTGSDLSSQDVRAYQTNLPINYHNDGADAFMLLCFRAAESGGRSKLVSAVSVFNTILDRRPDLAAVLQEPFDFDARGQQRPGAAAWQHVPIYSWFAGHLNVLYKREYIDLAQRFPDVPDLTPLQIEALDLMDAVCEELSMELEMQPGEIIVANNYDILHARSGFSTSSDTPRHMLRLWLSLPRGRPLPPVFADTREFCHSYTRRQARR